MDNIGICVITYNRIESLKRLLHSLSNAQYPHEVDLIISVDKSNTEEVANYAKNFKWQHGHKEVITHDLNLGLRKHVLSCGELLNRYDALVVLEDDISVAESFFYFAEQCVTKFKDNNNIAGISLYCPPLNPYCGLPFIPLHSDSDIFLMQVAQSWGQVWMKNQWHEFVKWYECNNEEFEDMPHLPKAICNWKHNSWLKYHDRYCIEKNKFFVYPYLSLSTNHSDAGTHNATTQTFYQSPMLFGAKNDFNLNGTIAYDGFFENLNLINYIEFAPKDICIDFYGLKENRENKRFWLTCKNFPFRIVKSYSLSMKPYEFNVINNIGGNELFIYDTHTTGTQQKTDTETLIKSYLYATDMNVYGILNIKLKKFLYKLLRKQ